ncbi:MAG: hypothetical protein AB1713_04550 [Pseudomonadota bacterium]
MGLVLCNASITGSWRKNVTIQSSRLHVPAAGMERWDTGQGEKIRALPLKSLPSAPINISKADPGRKKTPAGAKGSGRAADNLNET